MHGFMLFRMGFSRGRLYYHATDELTMGIAFPEICQAVHAVWSCVQLCDITFQAMILVDLNIFQSLILMRFQP